MALQFTGAIGPQKGSDSGSVPIRQGRTGEVVIQQLNGRYYESAFRGARFICANQAGIATTAGATTANVLLVLSNDPGNTKNLVLLGVGFGYTAAPAAAGLVYLVKGFSSTPVTHTTPLAIQSGALSASAACQGKVDSSATLPATPLVVWPLGSILGASALTPPLLNVDMSGLLIITPGGHVAVQSTAIVTGIAAFAWDEVDP